MKPHFLKATSFFGIFWMSVALACPGLAVAQRSGHKPETQVARMTPDQLVDEYVNESDRHWGRFDDDYCDLVFKYVRQAGLKVCKRIIEIMESIDHARVVAAHTSSDGRRFEAATMLLACLDGMVVRLRGTEEGRQAITVLRHAIEKLHITDEPVLWMLKDLEGFRIGDDVIRNTLKLNYKVEMSDSEFREFVNYLIAHDPYYPSQSRQTIYKDYTGLKKGEYPRQDYIELNIEPFYKLYVQFKSPKN